MKSIFATLMLLPALFFADWTWADEVTFKLAGKKQTSSGEILEEPQDGSILFQARDGRIFELEKDQIVDVQRSPKSVEPLKTKELAKQLKEELGQDFRSHIAGDFVLVYNTEQDYARWVAGLYNKLNRGFRNFWQKKKLKLPSRSRFPLGVLIFKNRADYNRYMQRDLGVVNQGMIAYYNFQTNRIAMFDLTAEAVRGNGRDKRNIVEVLNNPLAVPMVATVVHEGVHQLMFNYGMQTRYADTPLWLNEGLAMYFETPDMKADRGWRKIGQINFLRYGPFLEYLQRRPTGSLRRMITNDQALRGEEAINNYGQAWAFTYFLIDKHEKNFVKYLKHIAEKPILVFDSETQRLAEFEKFIEVDLSTLDREFVQYIQTLDKVKR